MKIGETCTYEYDDFCIWTDIETDGVCCTVEVDLKLLDPGASPTFDPVHGGDPGWAPELELEEIRILIPGLKTPLIIGEVFFTKMFEGGNDLLNNAIEFGMDEALS
jgi:hypothetical protein